MWRSMVPLAGAVAGAVPADRSAPAAAPTTPAAAASTQSTAPGSPSQRASPRAAGTAAPATTPATTRAVTQTVRESSRRQSSSGWNGRAACRTWRRRGVRATRVSLLGQFGGDLVVQALDPYRALGGGGGDRDGGEPVELFQRAAHGVHGLDPHIGAIRHSCQKNPVRTYTASSVTSQPVGAEPPQRGRRTAAATPAAARTAAAAARGGRARSARPVRPGGRRVPRSSAATAPSATSSRPARSACCAAASAGSPAVPSPPAWAQRPQPAGRRRPGRRWSCRAPAPVPSVRTGSIFLARTLPSSTPHWSKESMFQMAPWTKTLCS
ncbi:hypothetical protein SMICM17S_13191 [Streptomyces microflavus]